MLYFAAGDILIIKYRNEQNDPFSFLVFNCSTANKKMHENIPPGKHTETYVKV